MGFGHRRDDIGSRSGGDRGLRRLRRSEAELHMWLEWRDGQIPYIHDYRYGL
jgi:hypothetical protein